MAEAVLVYPRPQGNKIAGGERKNERDTRSSVEANKAHTKCVKRRCSS